MVTFRRLRNDAKFPRNLDIFWSVHRDDLSQAEVAAKYGISQQRVSQIVRRMGAQVALAPADEYDGIPQGAQLQFGVRVVLEQFKKRHGNLQLAWEKSMGLVSGASGVKDSLDPKAENARERAASWYKSQHGDWRIDRQLHDLEKTMVEARMLLYSRKWYGWEEAAKDQAALDAKKPPRKRRQDRAEATDGTDGHGCGNVGPAAPVEECVGSELDKETTEGLLLEVARYVRGLRAKGDGQVIDGEVVREVCSELMGCLGKEVALEEKVLSTEYSVPGTEEVKSESVAEAPAAQTPAPTAVELAEAAAKSEVVAEAASAATAATAPESAIRNPKSAMAQQSAIPPKAVKPATGRHWMTGPDPLEVLSRNERKMTPEEYEQHLKDLATMSMFGSYPGSCRAPAPLWGPAKKRS